MTKRKLYRFQENKTFKNLFQYTYSDLHEKGFPLKGRWHEAYFKNQNPILLELGCGKGEYTLEMALQNTNKNYIGIDIKGARLWRGCKTATEKHLKHVAFIRTKINWITHFFDSSEIDEIWLTFPDPQPQKSREKKRLTSPPFLDLYRQILNNRGTIHLKTDNQHLYQYTLEIINQQRHELLFAAADIYNSDLDNEATAIQTFYEKKFLEQGNPITYLKFRLGHE